MKGYSDTFTSDKIHFSPSSIILSILQLFLESYSKYNAYQKNRMAKCDNLETKKGSLDATEPYREQNTRFYGPILAHYKRESTAARF